MSQPNIQNIIIKTIIAKLQNYNYYDIQIIVEYLHDILILEMCVQHNIEGMTKSELFGVNC